MAFVALPGGIRVAMEFNLIDKVVVNIYHVSTTDPIVSVKLLAIANIFVDWWTTDFQQNFSQDLLLAKVTAHDVSVANGEKEEVTLSPPDGGSITEGPISNNVALVVSLRTIKTGRSFQGRSYLAGINKSDIIDNDISIAKAASFVADYGTLMSVLDSADAPLVIASYVSGGVPRTTAVATEVSGVAAKRRVDTQRRRLPKE